MSNPFTRPMTDDEAIAYDSGLVDGRVEERQRIIELLEPFGECEPSICGKGCRGQYRCIGWAYRHAIALIKGREQE